MRPHRRQTPLDHVLIAGDVGDLPAIEALLQLLPDHAYGQVLLEIHPGIEAPSLATPQRVTVTHLVHDDATERVAPSVLAIRGTLLTEAVTAWVSEWMPEMPQADRDLSIWLGARSSDSLNALCCDLPVPVTRL